MAAKKYPRFAEHLEKLCRALLVANTTWTKARAEQEIASLTGYGVDTIKDWRKGERLPPQPSTVKLLAGMGNIVGLDRFWGMGLAVSCGVPSAIDLVNSIWGLLERRSIPCNLPHPTYITFVGREVERERLLRLLSPNHASALISIDGIGGVGKTALALAVAYACRAVSEGETYDPRVPSFDAIIFVSAKQQLLTPRGIESIPAAQRTLHDIFQEIARTLRRPGIANTSLANQRQRVLDALERQRTLLIIDNLETIADKEDIISFLYDVPHGVKVVITTREGTWFSPIRLEHLPREDGLKLLEQEAHDKQITLSNADAEQLYERTSGVPAAMMYAIGQLADRHTLDAILTRLTDRTGDIARFCFQESVVPLRGTSAHHLLMTIAMFPKRPHREAVVSVAGLQGDLLGADRALSQLERLSLVQLRDHRYTMIPLTREYVISELAAHPVFERSARERWLQWYLDYAHQNGGQDWQEWHIRYRRLEEEWTNFLAVFDWCAAYDRYAELRRFWHDDQDAYVAGFCNIYGRHWPDRLFWFDWLIQAAEQRGDWITAITAMSDKGFTLIIMGQPEQLEEASSVLDLAWNRRSEVTVARRAELAQNIGILNTRLGNYAIAKDWLQQAQALVQQSDLNEPLFTRQTIPIPYYTAEIFYHLKDYDQAKTLYEQVVTDAKRIGWERAVVYAQNWLADIAIAQEQYVAATRLLDLCQPVAERNMDARRIAFCKRSRAYLAKAQGDRAGFMAYAVEAYDQFDRLGMQQEAETLHHDMLPSST